MTRRSGVLSVLAATLLLLTGAPAVATAAPAAPVATGVPEDPAPTGPECTTTPSSTQPGYAVADPRCEFSGAAYTGARFTPTTDAAGRPVTRTYTGIVRGAGYRIEVPKRWNGELVLYAHGYRGTGTTVWVNNPTLRAYYVQRGFAWAASSYATNGYDVGQGVRDTQALIGLFRGTIRKARSVYLTGESMGGHVTAVAIERYRGDFVGAMPYCGVLGDKELFDYFLDANVTAAALTGTDIRFPESLAAGQAYAPTYAGQVLAELPALGSGFNSGNPAAVSLTALGTAWAGTVQQRSGGTRPGFASAFAFWSSFGYRAADERPVPVRGLSGTDRRHDRDRRRQRDRQPADRLPDRGRVRAAHPGRAGAEPVRAAGDTDHRALARAGRDPEGLRRPADPGAVAARHRGPVRAVLDGAGVRRAGLVARAVPAVRLPGDPRRRALRLHPGRAAGGVLGPGGVGAARRPAGG